MAWGRFSGEDRKKYWGKEGVTLLRSKVGCCRLTGGGIPGKYGEVGEGGG